MSYRFTLLLLPLLITGCATTSITPVIKEKPVRPYRNIMTLVVRSRTMDFRQFDADTYQNHIEDKFNNLANIEYRQQLERSLQRNLSAKNSQVLASSALFEVNERVTYEDFVTTLNDRDIEAILLINVSGYWYTESDYYDADTGMVWEDEEPNATFLCYLVDMQSGRPFWMAKSTVNGIFAGYDTLNNHLARKVSRELREERYIFSPVRNR